jgi:hypothetical protein
MEIICYIIIDRPINKIYLASDFRNYSSATSCQKVDLSVLFEICNSANCNKSLMNNIKLLVISSVAYNLLLVVELFTRQGAPEAR